MRAAVRPSPLLWPGIDAAEPVIKTSKIFVQLCHFEEGPLLFLPKPLVASR